MLGREESARRSEPVEPQGVAETASPYVPWQRHQLLGLWQGQRLARLMRVPLLGDDLEDPVGDR